MDIDLRNFEAADRDMVPVLRAMSGMQRLEVANQMWLMARQMIESQLAYDHPDWDEARLAEEVARRMAHGAG